MRVYRNTELLNWGRISTGVAVFRVEAAVFYCICSWQRRRPETQPLRVCWNRACVCIMHRRYLADLHHGLSGSLTSRFSLRLPLCGPRGRCFCRCGNAVYSSSLQGSWRICRQDPRGFWLAASGGSWGFCMQIFRSASWSLEVFDIEISPLFVWTMLQLFVQMRPLVRSSSLQGSRRICKQDSRGFGMAAPKGPWGFCTQKSLDFEFGLPVLQTLSLWFMVSLGLCSFATRRDSRCPCMRFLAGCVMVSHGL